jgi:hypothetical protein
MPKVVPVTEEDVAFLEELGSAAGHCLFHRDDGDQ